MSNMEKNNSSSYLNEINPEVFSARPRPGGLALIDSSQEIPVQTADSTEKHNKPTSENADSQFNKTTRNYRIQQVISSAPWGYLDLEEVEGVAEPNPLNNSIDMLGITISTIMLLSVDYKDIPQNYLQWTYSYLDMIRDEVGHNPPNIQGILNHIQQVTGGKMESLITQQKPETSDDQKSASPTAPEAAAEEITAEAPEQVAAVPEETTSKVEEPNDEVT